jgi:hypothetical protein
LDVIEEYLKGGRCKETLATQKMIEKVHEHIINELGTNSRTDTVFVVTAILLNLLTLGINSAIANSQGSTTRTIVMSTFAALVVVVNLVSEIGLLRGRQMRKKLLDGLLKMYKDQGVEGYYDPSLLGDYKVRYNMFLIAVLFTGLVALVIPFVIRPG